jgi:MFS family permease
MANDDLCAARRPTDGLPYWPLAALVAMNLLNYLDRQIVSAMLPTIQTELHLGDTQGGMLGSAFTVVYFIVCPLFGWLGDRGRRPTLLALGVGMWSLATAATGLTRTFYALLGVRAAVGIGEAAYGVIAPALLSDLVPAKKRGRVLSYFYFATPVGGALGYLLGGVLDAAIGWRHTFYWVGLPGLLLAFFAYRMRDPQRGEADAPQAPQAQAKRSTTGLWSTYASLRKNRLYVFTVAGNTAYTFALGGLAFWMPSYLARVRHYEMARGMLIFGVLTAVTGMAGTLVGGAVGDRWQARHPHGYSRLNALSMLGATVFSLLALLSASEVGFVLPLVVALFCMFLSSGPVNAQIIGAVPAQARATAMATSVFFIHLLGDAISPSFIGYMADLHGLHAAMLMVPAFFLLAGGLWFAAPPDLTPTSPR